MTGKPAANEPRKTATKSKPKSAPTAPGKVTTPKAATPATAASKADQHGQTADPDGNAKLRKADFIERVATRSALKKNQVKPVLEAALAVLGDALDAGETLQIPPLGRIKVRKVNENDKGKTIVCQLRRNHAMNSGAIAVAKGFDDD